MFFRSTLLFKVLSVSFCLLASGLCLAQSATATKCQKNCLTQLTDSGSELFCQKICVDNTTYPAPVRDFAVRQYQCNTLRQEILNSQKRIATPAQKQQVEYFCSGIDREAQMIKNRYRAYPKVLQLLDDNTQSQFYLQGASKPVEYGNTIDVLFAPDILDFAVQMESCEHFLGEFAGDRSKRDRDINCYLTKNCSNAPRRLKNLQKKYRNNRDVLLFLGEFHQTTDQFQTP